MVQIGTFNIQAEENKTSKIWLTERESYSTGHPIAIVSYCIKLEDAFLHFEIGSFSRSVAGRNNQNRLWLIAFTIIHAYLQLYAKPKLCLICNCPFIPELLKGNEYQQSFSDCIISVKVYNS